MALQYRINRPLLYQEVVNALYQIIDEQEIKPGDQLPSERELIEQMGVSRNVLREAFHVLEQRGIIISRQGKGRFLRVIPRSQSGLTQVEQMSRNLERCSLFEAYEVRQVLEVKAMELIVRNASDQDLQELERAYTTMLQRFSDNDNTEGEFEMHRMYARKTGSVFMEQTLEIVLSSVLEMMHTTSHTLMDMHQAEIEKKQHRTILNALLARDEEAARDAMFQHIQTTLDLLQQS